MYCNEIVSLSWGTEWSILPPCSQQRMILIESVFSLSPRYVTHRQIWHCTSSMIRVSTMAVQHLFTRPSQTSLYKLKDWCFYHGRTTFICKTIPDVTVQDHGLVFLPWPYNIYLQDHPRRPFCISHPCFHHLENWITTKHNIEPMIRSEVHIRSQIWADMKDRHS
jgi:hypothetical protein